MRFSVVLAVALLAALTHGDATEVQGQITGETQHAEQVAVEAKAGQSLLLRSSSREVVQRLIDLNASLPIASIDSLCKGRRAEQREQEQQQQQPAAEGQEGQQQ